MLRHIQYTPTPKAGHPALEDVRGHGAIRIMIRIIIIIIIILMILMIIILVIIMVILMVLITS